MAIDTASPRSRRNLLAAAAGGALGVVATKLGAPDPVAATSTAVLTETTTMASNTTGIEGDGDGFDIFLATAPGSATAIKGESATGVGVYGACPGAGLGVAGIASSGFGVAAISLTGTGLCAATEIGLPT
jgi:hypothetical protein